MRNNFADARVQRDLQNFTVVFQIDAAGRLQPEIMAGAGLCHCDELIAVFQAPHREVFD